MSAWHYFLNIYSYIYWNLRVKKKHTHTHIHRDIFHLLIHFTCGWIGRGWPGKTQELRAPSESPTWVRNVKVVFSIFNRKSVSETQLEVKVNLFPPSGSKLPKWREHRYHPVEFGLSSKSRSKDSDLRIVYLKNDSRNHWKERGNEAGKRRKVLSIAQ